MPLASPAAAAPACVVLNWRSGDTCAFEAPAGAFVFGGVATAREGEGVWIAVEVVFNGVVIDSCYGSAVAGEAAACEGNGQAFAPSLTHVCRVWGSGGPKFHCADPPALPMGR
ncbi:MAG TPA: hypothetical protein VNQ77_16755 [Frankiaceae bacterium]|nr:hypothetical protein [Frankiaceae bacterium]